MTTEIQNPASFALLSGLLRAACRDAELKGTLIPADAEAAQRTIRAVAAVTSDPDTQGSVCIPWADVEAREPQAAKGLGILRELGLIGDPGSPAPWALDAAGRLYPARFFDEERRLAESLAARAKSLTGEAAPTPEALTLVGKMCEALGTDEAQSAAVRGALEQRLLIVSGGPGTGKTTSVVMMLEGLLAMKPDLRIGLAAPTGKAASRMLQSIRESLSRQPLAALLTAMRALDAGTSPATMEAKTIHKWLVTRTPTGEMPGPGNPMALDLLVVDEASMIDIHLAARLLSALSPETRLILLGDKHQLAAVGPGSVFADLTEEEGALAANTAVLKESRRFERGSIVWALASVVNQMGIEGDAAVSAVKTLLTSTEADAPGLIRTLFGTEAPTSARRYQVAWHDDAPDPQTGLSESVRMWLDASMEPYLEALADCTDFWQKHRTAVRKSRGTYADGKLAAEEEKLVGALWRALESFRPLAAQREGESSVAALNRWAEGRVTALLRQKGALDERFPLTHYAGRAVIVRKNDDVLGVFNGDVGIELPLGTNGVADPDAPPRFVTYFGRAEGEGVRVPSALLPEHDTAFAMTIHQSQGSEFARVAVLLPAKPDSALSTRELLYTGITRTKAEVTVFGSEEALARSVSEPTRRLSGLADRIREACAGAKDV